MLRDPHRSGRRKQSFLSLEDFHGTKGLALSKHYSGMRVVLASKKACQNFSKRTTLSKTER
ncbi:hypothetical protein MPNT_310022 [Candidatus Methylacidithermus pantelleriae]|uniref:Uncharacterized protein n=1 Tax=Candidatus Methylacidithermus pantelleriae TaxID=2744239 RepID=A0A8J2FP31_9BACT|nr:hypothetical protein MPNT_310022 [Candidatus Methylacidithermus pantelleriae]